MVPKVVLEEWEAAHPPPQARSLTCGVEVSPLFWWVFP